MYFTTPVNTAASDAASTCDSTTDRSYGCVCKIPSPPPPSTPPTPPPYPDHTVLISHPSQTCRNPTYTPRRFMTADECEAFALSQGKAFSNIGNFIFGKPAGCSITFSNAA